MPGYSYLFSRSAQNDLKKLDPVTRKRIAKKLQYVANQSDVLLYAKPLTDSALGDYRFRIGHYRVIFDLDQANILVHKVQHRRDTYRR